MNTIGGNTPKRFQGALEMAKRRMLSKPGGPRILNIKCWNEWTEGSYLLLGLALGGVALVLAPTVDAGETGASETVNYARPFEPPTRPAFLPLPPGAVEPAGWLRDWCVAARDGYTGHMDAYDDEFKRAWAPDRKMTGEGLFWYKGAWPYEGGGYRFDGLGRLSFALHDEAMIARAKRRLYAVADNMNTDGLLFLWWFDRNNPEDRHEM